MSRNGDFDAVGAVWRDHLGVFLGASAIVIRGITDLTTLEAMSMREALLLAEDLYVHNILVAMDCKIVVDNAKWGSATNYGAIIREIMDRLANFSSCNIVHEYRSSNVEAHNLAKHALTLGANHHAWLGQPGDLLFISA